MNKALALVVDDEVDILDLLKITLKRMEVQALTASTLAEARQQLERNRFDLCLTDMNLSDGSGLELIRHISEHYPQLPVAMITAHGNMESAVLAMKAGAFDFVAKPVDLQLLRRLVGSALKLRGRSGASDGEVRLLGDSPAMEQIRRLINKLARHQAPVFITGESGTGKELAARLIHAQGPRSEGRFVAVNCGAIPSELVESELFGHKKGSFTGAIGDKEGLFQAAEGGTLFLDEVADLPLLAQVKLLRAIQEKRVRPIGTQREVPVDVRIISASHRDLNVEVEQGRFRQDLFYRINVIELRMPALRERPQDIPLLAAQILRRLAPAPDGETAALTLTPAAIAALQQQSFPGNVRELENILERAIALGDGDLIDIDDLYLKTAPIEEIPPGPPFSKGGVKSPPPPLFQRGEEETPPFGKGHEKPPFSKGGLGGFDETGRLEGFKNFNHAAAAQALGISERSLHWRLIALGLEPRPPAPAASTPSNKRK
ncbi:sigma-54 dependent transcriptional regulator [Chromatium okenii]|uniref:sigma-54-dependent transcriptional regulator n=1 Tax=Chromatium okenii TaxID=61644 RepID=UPI0026EE6225|nr:sigma-54 dependent transcriptional regulator [Chromatium okenii]MBV5309366.1 sigma-54-dependent Fis family transcriptional regulator [Chromatium okenii]